MPRWYIRDSVRIEPQQLQQNLLPANFTVDEYEQLLLRHGFVVAVLGDGLYSVNFKTRNINQSQDVVLTINEAGLRVVWLLFLIVAATLTVSVLQLFETSLEAVTSLALFIPLLVGTGGNVGAQAATSAVRALAVGEVRPSDALRVAWRESRVGVILGVVLGALAFGAGWLVAGLGVGITVGVSVVLVCIWAATVGSLMPLMAKAIKIDPAVISAPLVTTLVDATGLLIYFAVAGVVLGI